MKYVERIGACQPTGARLVDRLLDRALPMHCVLCGLFSGPPGICVPCRNDLPWNRNACRSCAMPLPATGEPVCGPCLQRTPAWQAASAALNYEFPVRQLVGQFKFRRNMAVGRVLAEMLADYLADRGAERPELLIPVPLHGWRLLTRGFNQAFDIARHLGRVLDIPLANHDLRRTRPTRSQTGLDAVARRRNLRNAFTWRGKDLRERHVALVDDVLTTGTTAAECARVLGKAGAGRIDVWVLARAAKSP